VEVMKIGEKYECGSFKRTMGQMKALDLQRQQDPILNLNPSFYGTKQESLKSREPFTSLENVRQEALNKATTGIVPSMLLHYEYTNPLSFHSETTSVNPFKT